MNKQNVMALWIRFSWVAQRWGNASSTVREVCSCGWECAWWGSGPPSLVDRALDEDLDPQRYVSVHTSTYQYELVCTSIYQCIQLPVLLTSYQYVLAFTSIYQYIQVHTSIYLYVLACAGIYCGTLAVASHAWVVWLWRRLQCLRKLCERTKPIVLQRLVGAGGRTERDPMKCAVWFLSVPVCTSMYQYVLVCTMNRLNLSSFEIQLRHIVSHAKELYSLYLISSDSFWMSQETTCLLECTYWYVPVHTSTYDREILVQPCTVLYRYVLVRTSMYRFAQSCPGVQDSRWNYLELLRST